jgi:DNA-binding response OmpR family regulator
MVVASKLAKVLVRQDSAIVAADIEAGLHRYGYQVEIRMGTAFEVILMSTKLNPDLIILDMEPGDKCGLEAAREFYDIARTPMVLISTDADNVSCGDAALPCRCVAKPFLGRN